MSVGFDYKGGWLCHVMYCNGLFIFNIFTCLNPKDTDGTFYIGNGHTHSTIIQIKITSYINFHLFIIIKPTTIYFLTLNLKSLHYLTKLVNIQ